MNWDAANFFANLGLVAAALGAGSLAYLDFRRSRRNHAEQMESLAEQHRRSLKPFVVIDHASFEPRGMLVTLQNIGGGLATGVLLRGYVVSSPERVPHHHVLRLTHQLNLVAADPQQLEDLINGLTSLAAGAAESVDYVPRVGDQQWPNPEHAFGILLWELTYQDIFDEQQQSSGWAYVEP